MTILPTGECFSDAAEYIEGLAKVRDPEIDLTTYHIVHAICRSFDQPELGWFAHGWVENDEIDSVIFSGILNGKKIWLIAAKADFYKTLHIQHPRRYTMREVAEWNIKTGNLGPWEEPYTNFTRQALAAESSGPTRS